MTVKKYTLHKDQKSDKWRLAFPLDVGVDTIVETCKRFSVGCP